jgi:hypothetical protein
MSSATLEAIARAIHEDYLRRESGNGAVGHGARSLLPWDSLPESLRRSNRNQALHIEQKLAAVGCEAIPSSVTTGPPMFRFSEQEIDVLARMEHERWVEERARDGWTLAPDRDAFHKRTPYLVAWDLLPEPARDLDRETVRGIPRFLAAVGFGVVRRG